MNITVQQIMNECMAMASNRLEGTVDTLKFGDPSVIVTGIVTAFMPTQFVLEEAVRLGANLVIVHEGMFFSHHDGIEPAKDDPVYQTKWQWIESSGLAIFRFHDHMHHTFPDLVMEGLVRELGWSVYVREHRSVATVVTLPKLTLADLVLTVKRRLHIPFVRVIGEPDITCETVGLLAGYRGGGTTAIPLFGEADVLIYGEGPEWETPEYVRDALYQGRRKGLIVLGHAESEEPGMKLLCKRLRQRYPHLPVHYVKEKPLFSIY
ncbi:putative NIF3 family GTP cyclohydrolase 1 type 2 [Anoxybacillus tepidamans]|uniref:GTP cyclohydrolase 1 type 2 homolog n=1 Tax=Anoxybacteroides tepidamans TaxID=265948 RepID=A0A7W8IRW2_9BACL|nr:Nif3-like dinuclear metal center hexameric protein [Anoxybacillus tepidamans]MBB5325504.1 putative NIF3 family GTP cyclohydrolase 1 type 2 [Anoxybacillus tepidamans]